MIAKLKEASKEVNTNTAAQEDEILKELASGGLEVSYLTDDQVSAFKEALKDVIAKYKAEYGQEACDAFLIP